ncbi:uncharacterized protein LOC134846996 isoform X2 [Symsagittifera roscoffensis]
MSKKTPQICAATEAEDGAPSRNLHKEGIWEKRFQTVFFGEVLPMFPEAVFIDIGTQLGTYTIPVAALGKTTYSFEPVRRTVEFLRHSIALNNFNDRIHLYNYALMDSIYCVQITRPVSNPYLGRSIMTKTDDCNQKLDGVNVAVLDNLLPILKKDNVKQAILKIDIEGSEAKAILGGLKLFREIDIAVIQMEFHVIQSKMRDGTKEEGEIVMKFIEQMKEMGYKASPVVRQNKNSKWYAAKNVLSYDKLFKRPTDVLWHRLS